jgi:hypothetical protein
MWTISMPAVEGFRQHVNGRARSGRTEVEFPRILLGIGDEFFERPGGHLRVDGDGAQGLAQARDRLQILDRIEIDLAHVRNDSEHRQRGQKHGVAVRRRARYCRCSDATCGSALIVDNDRFLEAGRKHVRKRAANGIAGSARREGHDKPDIALRKLRVCRKNNNCG